MANENYETGKVTIQHEYRFTEIEYWNEFQREKKEIQDRYPNQPWLIDTKRGLANNRPEEGWWKEWKQYQKEITDLMLKPYGNFDKFLYEIRPARDMMPIDIWMRGKYNTDGYNKTKNRNEK